MSDKPFLYVHPLSEQRGRDLLDFDDYVVRVSRLVPAERLYVSALPLDDALGGDFDSCDYLVCGEP